MEADVNRYVSCRNGERTSEVGTYGITTQS